MGKVTTLGMAKSRIDAISKKIKNKKQKTKKQKKKQPFRN